MKNVYINQILERLSNELRKKLALFPTKIFKGVITWVTKIICWYRLQNTVIRKFKRHMRKFESKKKTYLNAFI